MYSLIESIRRHEQERDVLYLDTEGNLTGGIGHCFKVGTKLPKNAIDAIFKMDIADVINDFNRIPLIYRKHLDENRRRVIVEMIFNMGLGNWENRTGVMGFHNMWLSILEDDFDRAANEMLDSKWARRVKGRADELAEIMKTGG